MVGSREAEERRQRIYEIVVAEPGIHKSALCRRTGLAWGTASHHLAVLRRQGLVRYIRIAGRTHVAPAQGLELAEAMVMPRSKEILALLRQGPRGPSAIASDLSLGRKVVRSHLDALVADGVLETDDAYHPRYWLADRH